MLVFHFFWALNGIQVIDILTYSVTAKKIPFCLILTVYLISVCTDHVSSCRGLKLIPVINHIHLFVIVALIELLQAHPDGIVQIAGRCLQKWEEEVCFVRWREGLKEDSDVILAHGLTAWSKMKQKIEFWHNSQCSLFAVLILFCLSIHRGREIQIRKIKYSNVN